VWLEWYHSFEKAGGFLRGTSAKTDLASDPPVLSTDASVGYFASRESCCNGGTL